MINQEELFDDKPYMRSLNVIKNGENVKLPFEEIFDHSTYTELLVVTFVTSPAFFLKKQMNLRKYNLF